ncbi:uncharacterized protein [Centruroides vittatus]|uniref:uncharacterized protein n=1 Tax=Centruroides vittatus TaxID=120091 RepID=UPI00350E92F5
MIQEWEKALQEAGINNQIKLGTKHKGVKINSLAFADDFAAFAKYINSAITQINLLGKIAKKAGLQISTSKTEYMTNISGAPKSLKTEFGEINKVSKFKYLGEIIETNELSKEANYARTRKLEIAYQLSKDIYNKKINLHQRKN